MENNLSVAFKVQNSLFILLDNKNHSRKVRMQFQNTYLGHMTILKFHSNNSGKFDVKAEHIHASAFIILVGMINYVILGNIIIYYIIPGTVLQCLQDS